MHQEMHFLELPLSKRKWVKVKSAQYGTASVVQRGSVNSLATVITDSYHTCWSVECTSWEIIQFAQAEICTDG